MKSDFMIHKSDTFLHAQEIISGQAGAKLAISHVKEDSCHYNEPKKLLKFK